MILKDAFRLMSKAIRSTLKRDADNRRSPEPIWPEPPRSTWEQYLSIEELFEESGVQIRFLQGKLEIAPPVSEYHENRKSHIARLVETWCVEKDVNFFGKGNYTMLNPEESGGEPDECYCLRENKEWPDLVIEVALTSGGLSKRKFYATFPIPELWIWRNEKLEVHTFNLDTQEYETAEESVQLPGIDLDCLVECSQLESTRDAIVTFRDRIS